MAFSFPDFKNVGQMDLSKLFLLFAPIFVGNAVKNYVRLLRLQIMTRQTAHLINRTQRNLSQDIMLPVLVLLKSSKTF